MCICKKITVFASFLLFAGGIFAEDILIGPGQAISRRAAKVSFDSEGILLKVSDPEWSAGLQLNPPQGKAHWDLTRWKVLAVDVENLSIERQMRLTMHLSSGSRESKNFCEANTGIALNPGEKRTMRILLPHAFMYAVPEGAKGMKTLDTSSLNPIEFQIQWPFEPKIDGLVNCRISGFRGEDPIDLKEIKPLSKGQYFPFIDRYGQFIHSDWPEKIRTDADLKRNLEEEATQLAALPRPSSWNRYGAWNEGPRMEASGSFRTAKYKGKWYLVDPEGCLFFSHGLDVLYPHTDATKTKAHENWFSDMPEGAESLAFTDHNLQIKYGKKDYDSAFYQTLCRRLESWGFNTIGDWGRSELMAMGRTPYAMQLTDYNAEWPGFQGSKLKFYDVFDPRFEERMSNLLAERAKLDPQTRKSINDPMCIGYFIDNELAFGAYIKELMKASPVQPAKLEFFRDLKEKYKTIDALNLAWKSRYENWTAFLEGKDEPDSEGFKKDSRAFHAKSVTRYFELCRAGIKNVAPHRLYLGCRFVGLRQPDYIWAAAAKYCDVISVNTYVHSAANCNKDDFLDKPVLIGEFHFGVFDRGMFSASLCPSGITQSERSIAYTRFMQGVLVHPNIVGAHWFQFRDQPLTGRWDGEGYQIGFVDVADTPYKEMTAAARVIGENMYRYRENSKLANSMIGD